MELTKQVVSLELAQKLKELGVKQESIWIWKTVVLNGLRTTRLEQMGVTEDDYPAFWSAFTVAELGEMLPVGYRSFKRFAGQELVWRCEAASEQVYDRWPAEADTEADARGVMLIHLLENKLLANK